MGIASAILLAAIFGFWGLIFSSDKEIHFEDIAILTGYDSAVGLALNNRRSDIENQSAIINGRLKALHIRDIEYPEDLGDGSVVAKFVNSVSAQLLQQSVQLQCAFLVGFVGFVENNTPGKYPDFDLRIAASCAGFPAQPTLDDRQYLEVLISNAKQRLK